MTEKAQRSETGDHYIHLIYSRLYRTFQKLLMACIHHILHDMLRGCT